jgi:pyruvate formate lyase activating enzyme
MVFIVEIYGLQKLTLLDYPNTIACSIFLGGCPFRCPYCHNYELVDGSAKPIMTEEELFDFLQERKGMLDGVAITGGEPCMHPDLPEFIIKMRELGYKIKLDTNGYYPEMLQKLIDEKLVDYVAMDIKNCPSLYSVTVAKDIDTERIHQSKDILMKSDVLMVQMLNAR